MSITILKIPFEGEYIVQGDTISKTSFAFTNEDIDLTTATIKMQIFNGDIKIIDISNSSGITIVDADNFYIDEVDATSNNLPYGSFLGDLKITDVNGKRHTYTRVEYTILKQYTRP